MTLIEAEFGSALYSPVKRKANATGKLRYKAGRVASNSSEVMVKITGFGKGAAHVKAHLDYISRNGKVELENDRGEMLTGKEDVKALFKDWEKSFSDDGGRHKRDTMHMVLSMPETTDPESVRNAVREFTRSAFSKNHEYVFALHTDEPHPHCHVTVKCLGFDGKRLNPKKADLQEWREKFAEKLRDQGVEAEASPRRSRGVVRKAEPNVIRHIEKGDSTHPPRVSKVRAAQIKEAAQELAAESKGLPVAEKPWEQAIRARQREVRRAWLSAADALDQADTRLKFNDREEPNDRPAYERVTAERARAGQRAAAVYQSHLGKTVQGSAPATLAGLRDVSSLGVVQHRRSAEMLLRPNASDRVGRRGAADHEVRRPGAGLTGSGSERELTGTQGLAAQNKALAGRIRAFVAAMPAIDTARHRLKSDLAKSFTKAPEQSAQPKPLGGSHDPGQSAKKGPEQAGPKGGRDSQR